MNLDELELEAKHGGQFYPDVILAFVDRIRKLEGQITYMANTAHQAYHHALGDDMVSWRECSRSFCKSAVEICSESSHA